MMGITINISFALLFKSFLSFFIPRFAFFFLSFSLFFSFFILLFFFLPLFFSFLPLFLLTFFLFLLFLKVNLLILHPSDIVQQILLVFIIIDFPDMLIDIVIDSFFELISFCFYSFNFNIVFGLNIFDCSLFLNGALLILFLFF